MFDVRSEMSFKRPVREIDLSSLALYDFYDTTVTTDTSVMKATTLTLPQSGPNFWRHGTTWRGSSSVKLTNHSKVLISTIEKPGIVIQQLPKITQTPPKAQTATATATRKWEEYVSFLRRQWPGEWGKRSDKVVPILRQIHAGQDQIYLLKIPPDPNSVWKEEYPADWAGI